MQMYDEYLTADEQRLIDTLKNKSRMEKDLIIGAYKNDTISINR